MSQQEIVRDLLAKLDLPKAVRKQLIERQKLQ